MPFREAIGEVSTEQFCPYPPGVPLLAPGERVTDEVVEAIEVAGRCTRMAYCSDPRAETIEVVADVRAERSVRHVALAGRARMVGGGLVISNGIRCRNELTTS